MTPSDFIFAIDVKGECFQVTTKQDWVETGGEADQCCGGEWNADEHGFDEASERCFEYKGTVEEGKQKLLELGMTNPEDWQLFMEEFFE